MFRASVLLDEYQQGGRTKRAGRHCHAVGDQFKS
jgi:hypothetical protein